MKKNISILFFLLCSIAVEAQLPYTTSGQYAVKVEKDIYYGSAINYMGYEDTLLLDLYKPINDANENRPVLILLHGGTWLAGCKDETGTGIVPLANEFASRGYVVASINYRLGWHKSDYVPTPAAAPWPDTYKSLYAADSSELLRAEYRAMQDAKGAIRFLKNRNIIDSTCIANFYVGGESAGAFIAIATAYLDREEEKPISCFTIDDAPTPQYNLPNAISGCDYKVFALNENSLKRNDLGSVDGDLNINDYDAKIKGVISFFGGVPYEAFSKDWFVNNADIPLYLYHQTCDGIVDFNHGKPMAVISYNCNLGYTPWHYNYPTMYGSNAIQDSLTHFGGYSLLTDFDYCDPFVIPLFDCIRYADNGSYHYTNNIALSAATTSEFLSPFITANENDTDCKSLYYNIEEQSAATWHIYPNPFSTAFTITGNFKTGSDVELEITDLVGAKINCSIDYKSNSIQIKLTDNVSAGIYIIHLNQSGLHSALKVIKL